MTTGPKDLLLFLLYKRLHLTCHVTLPPRVALPGAGTQGPVLEGGLILLARALDAAVDF